MQSIQVHQQCVYQLLAVPLFSSHIGGINFLTLLKQFLKFLKLNSLFWCIVLRPDKHILPCSHHDYQETECFYHSKNLPHDSLQFNSTITPRQPRFCSPVLPFQECHINGTTKHIAICLASFIQHNAFGIHLTVISTVHSVIAEQYAIIWMYHSLSFC